MRKKNIDNFRFRNGKMNVPLLFLHRYLRLTPLLIVSVLFSVSLLRFFGNGPLWPNMIETLGTMCERYWWSGLLYIQNYVNPRETVSRNHSIHLEKTNHLTFLIIFMPVFRTFVVFECWYAAILDRTIGCLFDLSIPSQNHSRLDTVCIRLCCEYAVSFLEKRLQRIVSIIIKSWIHHVFFS